MFHRTAHQIGNNRSVCECGLEVLPCCTKKWVWSGHIFDRLKVLVDVRRKIKYRTPLWSGIKRIISCNVILSARIQANCLNKDEVKFYVDGSKKASLQRRIVVERAFTRNSGSVESLAAEWTTQKAGKFTPWMVLLYGQSDRVTRSVV